MKKFKYIILIFLMTVAAMEAKSQQLSKVEPALEILSNYPKIRDFTMSYATNEAYTTIQSPLDEISIIVCLKYKNNSWSTPEIVEFSGKYKDLEPFLSPNGLRLYFASNRPLNDSSLATKDVDIWYVERKSLNSNWSSPVNIMGPVNTEFDEFYPSVANNNNLYFTRDSPETKGKDDVFFSLWESDAYHNPVSLSDAINSAGYEFNSYVSPDESFLIYSGYNREGGIGSGDLYISLKNSDGTWRKATNLGKEINSAQMDYCPFVDIDSSTLYFTSRRSSVDGGKDFISMEDLVQELSKYENGNSRIYKVSIQNIISPNK
jgi:hypothetical protein